MGSFGDIIIDIWQYVLTIFFPQNIEVKCPPDVFNTTDPPSAPYFLSHLRPFQVVFLSIGTPLTLSIIGLSCFQWYYIWTLVSSEQRRNKLYFLITLLPVSALCCLIGMFCPRTAVLLSSFGLLYFLMCLLVLVSLIRHLSQGRNHLARTLAERGKMINFQSPPFCCFFCFLPKAHPTESNLLKLEYIVLQAPIVRVFIVFGQVIAVAEQREHALWWLHLFDLVSLASLLLAIFGIHTLARVTSDQLSHYGFIGIFRIVDFALLFFSAQQPMLFQNIFLRFNIIQCGPVLSPQDNARFICNFVIICEMFLLSLASTFLVNPRRNNLFDLYHTDKLSASPICSSQECGLETVATTITVSHLADGGEMAVAGSSATRTSGSNPMTPSTSTGGTESSHSLCTQMTLLCERID